MSRREFRSRFSQAPYGAYPSFHSPAYEGYVPQVPYEAYNSYARPPPPRRRKPSSPPLFYPQHYFAPPPSPPRRRPPVSSLFSPPPYISVPIPRRSISYSDFPPVVLPSDSIPLYPLEMPPLEPPTPRPEQKPPPPLQIEILPEGKRRVIVGGPPSFPLLPTVGVLFLAHAGVTQPTFWEEWKSKAQNRIAFVVHANPDVDTLNDERGIFAKRYGLPVSERVVPTAWCTSSLVLAMQRGLKYMLAKYPSIETIYFLSGDDIPIRSSQELLALPSQTRLCNSDNSVLNPIPPSDRKYTLPRDYKDSDFVSHTQFMSLTRKHAEAVVQTNLDVFNSMDRYLRNLVDHKQPGVSSTQAERCPDEYYIGSILTHLGFAKELVSNSCINIAFHPDGNTPTGVRWDDLVTKKSVYLGIKSDGTPDIESWTLEEAITAAREDPSVYFLRKVGSQVNLDDLDKDIFGM